MKISYIFYCSLLILFFASTALTQIKNDGAEWTRIEDNKLKFSVLFPPNYLVDNEIDDFPINAVDEMTTLSVIMVERPKVIGFQKSLKTSLSVYQIQKTSNSKKYIEYFVDTQAIKDEHQDFKIGDFVGRKTTLDTDKVLETNITIFVKNRVFVITASAKKEDESIYNKFVMSLNLNEKPMFKSQTSEQPEASASVLISSLQTSADVLDTLNNERNTFTTNQSRTPNDIKDENEIEKTLSRPLIILRRPHPEIYVSPEKGKNSVIAKLKVTFLANGEIGDVSVIEGFRSVKATKSAVEAAKKIKFLPAEINEKKVGVFKVVEYAFGNPIYP